MNTEYIRNSKGNIIGKMKKQGTKTYLEDAAGKRLGFYDPSNNSTFNAAGKLIARSNILLSLLKYN
jgi:hypothetical protein